MHEKNALSYAGSPLYGMQIYTWGKYLMSGHLTYNQLLLLCVDILQSSSYFAGYVPHNMYLFYANSYILFQSLQLTVPPCCRQAYDKKGKNLKTPLVHTTQHSSFRHNNHEAKERSIRRRAARSLRTGSIVWEKILQNREREKLHRYSH